MKMKMKIAYIGLVVVFFNACDIKKEYDSINSKTVNFAGDWYYQELSANTGVVNIDYQKYRLITYNTSANKSNEIWIDDQNRKINMKFKAVINGQLDSFAADYSPNVYYDTTVFYPEQSKVVGAIDSALQLYEGFELLSGKIIKNAAYSKTGMLVDSIFLHISAHLNRFIFINVDYGIDTAWQYQSSVNLLEEFIISGHRFTGFQDDDYK
jgi:hypothetical protein